MSVFGVILVRIFPYPHTVFLRFQSEYGKTCKRITPNTDTFYAVDLTYSVKCPIKNCLEFYNGESGRWLLGRVTEHSRKDRNSQMFKHSIAANHPTVMLDNFTVFNSGYRSMKFKRKYQNLYLSNRADLR